VWTEHRDTLDSYGNLTGRASRIGYWINQVAYRGYYANPKLQAMHDNAIESRKSLQLEAESERQAQELADLKLQRQGERAKQEREMGRLQAEHEQQIKQLHHSQALREQADEHAQEIGFKQELNGVELEHSRAKNAEEAALLQSMQQMQVDLTRYLVAQYQHPDRLIRIDGQASGLHIHE